MEIPLSVRTAWLNSLNVTDSQRVSGGFSSSRVWKLTAHDGSYCLKAWPRDSTMQQRLTNIHKHLQLLADGQLGFVPRVIPNRRGAGLLEHEQWIWEVTTWLRGEADISGNVSIERRKSAADAIAQVHHLWRKNLVDRDFSPGLNGRIALLKEAHLQLPECSSIIKSRPSLDIFTGGESIDVESPEAIDLAQRTLQHLSRSATRLIDRMVELNCPLDLHFVMRDLHSDHILYVGDHVTGLIDFGAARWDEPMLDLVRWLSSQLPFDRSSRYESLEYYFRKLEELTGSRSGSDKSFLLRRFSVLDEVSTMLSAWYWFDWLVIERRTFSVPARMIALRWAQLLSRLDRSEW